MSADRAFTELTEVEQLSLAAHLIAGRYPYPIHLGNFLAEGDSGGLLWIQLDSELVQVANLRAYPGARSLASSLRGLAELDDADDIDEFDLRGFQ